MINVRSNRAKRQLARKQQLVMNRLENVYARKIDAILKAQYNAAANVASRGAYVVGIAIDMYFDKLKNTLRDLYTQATNIFGVELYNELKRASKKSVELDASIDEDYQRVIQQFIKENAINAATMIDTTTKEIIRKILATALAENWSIIEVRKAIEAKDTKYRSRMIAITETHSAVMGTQYVAALESDIPDEQIEKEWMAALDGRTRPTHANANGQTRALDKPFNVGGEELMYPGMYGASAKNVIHCRCQVLYNTRAEG